MTSQTSREPTAERRVREERRHHPDDDSHRARRREQRTAWETQHRERADPTLDHTDSQSSLQ